MIEEYKFGRIRIGGRTYKKDVEVHSTGQVRSWWREEGHVFKEKDLERVMREEPEVVVLGTGARGVARVPKETRDYIRDSGVRLVIDETGEAVRAFNKLLKNEKGLVVGLFHLTC